MQAIETKYHGATNSKGYRYSAQCAAGRIIVEAHDALYYDENHKRVALMLAEKLGWSGQWVGGGTKDGFAFVCVDSANPINSFRVE